EETVQWLGALPVERRTPTVVQRQKAWLAIGLFGLAISLAAVDLVYLPVALAAVGIAYVALRIISLNQIYESVEWPVIVLLASLIPIGAALESSGGTALIAEGILRATEGLAPLWVLLVIMVVTMTLSDMLNNVATVLVAGPVAVQVAQALDVNPDTMLMGVAVAASCAFLTPIGHKNNTIIMGPGGYSFGDYWRMGLPLELVVLAVSVPLILLVWPL
ncbi:MAG TPA: SLC13 family permease, partial [Thermopetrobacter sp.]|nr:SLC13 family permease [Thermopetrobacter sp.]